LTKGNVRILVTGANGFLGSNIVRALLGAGYSVRALRRADSSMTRVDDIMGDVEWLTIDESSEDSFFEFFEGVDCVIHTAASYGRKGESVVDIAKANTIFGLDVLNAAVEQKVKTFINADSALPKNTKPYTLSKAHFAEWGRYFAENARIRFINLRLEHMYGPGDDSVKFTNYVIDACLSNVPTLNLTEGTQERDFIYIGDVVSAYMLLLQRLTSMDFSYCDIALGSGETVSIRTLVETIHRLANSTTSLAFGATALGANDVMHSCADISYMKSLGWQPEMTLQQGLLNTIEYVKRGL
jgi:CDP-paratose synthetase